MPFLLPKNRKWSDFSMAGLTMEESSKLVATPLKRGVIQTIARESAVLENLPFLSVNGSAIAFVQEDKMATISFRDVNQGYEGENPTYIQKTEALKRLGGVVEVDRFIELTQNIHDVRAEATASKSKAIANEFTRVFFAGDEKVNPLEFNGLNARMIPSQEVDAEGFDLTTGMISEVIDKVMAGPDILFMNKKTRRALTAMFQVQGAYIQAGQDAFGRPQQRFADVPIAVVEDMFIPDNSVYAVKFGADEGIVGIQAGTVEAIDNGLRGITYQTLIEWFVSIMDGNPKGFARLKNFTI